MANDSDRSLSADEWLASDSGKPKILIADDNLVVIKLIMRTLGPEEYSFQWAQRAGGVLLANPRRVAELTRIQCCHSL